MKQKKNISRRDFFKLRRGKRGCHRTFGMRQQRKESCRCSRTHGRNDVPHESFDGRPRVTARHRNDASALCGRPQCP